MDTQRIYNNANLKKKRKKLLQEEAAANSPAKARQQFQSKRNRIDIAYDESVNPPEETQKTWRYTKDKLVKLFDSVSGNDKTHLLRLLKVVEKETDFFEDERYCFKFIEGCRELARWGDCWIRQPEDWINKTHNTERQFLGILNHLLAKYKVPAFMHKCFYVPDQVNRKHQEWFMHLGSGQNIRNANGLPFPLTKMMAHHFTQTPENFSIQEAFTFARIRSIGGSKSLTEAWLGSRMANTHSNSDFWDSVLRFFIDNPMLDLNQIGPIIDYLYNQKFVDNIELTQDGKRINHGPAQPFLSMKGRNPEVLLNQVDKWHVKTAKLKKRGTFVQWKSCGIDGARFEEGAGAGKKAFIITELLTSSELKEEGREMSHCVGSYSDSCSSGRCAVFSLRQVEGDGIGRKATISVNLNPNKVLNEARGKRNDFLPQNISRLVRSWAKARSITISSWAKI